ncbi:pectate lyase family protein [Streptomyces sp. 6N223]|uniref:pectate lyase family protein n=1 Tax=Streptomyces sp. 6N223 TaxID=3457412 RepID=UPI003FD36621
MSRGWSNAGNALGVVAAVAVSGALLPITAAEGSPAPGGNGTAQAPVAFPGAEGFGAQATGGRGGEIYHVTNLDDSGPGSFRDAVSEGPRIVVFDVGGYIELAEPLHVASDITIAGQTAPGEGVATRGYQVSFSDSSNVIVRYMRFRHGLTPDQNRDAVTMDGASNIVFDHVSASWGRDENFSINNSTNVTVQHSIISEGLDPHSCGGLVQSDGVTLSHNLYIHNKTRNPKSKGRLQFVNSVIYNWGSDGYILGDSAGISNANAEGNYFIAGPSTTGDPFTRANANYQIYAAGNYFDGDVNGQVDGRETTDEDLGPATIMDEPFDFPPVTVQTAQEAYDTVVAGAGASLSRDAIDTRLVNDVINQTGAIITDPESIGGFGSLEGGTPPADADGDGMPDDWETAEGLNPDDAADAADTDASGYSNIERYVNGLVA